MNFTRLNIALYPPKELREKVILLSKEIAQKNEAYFTLDDSRYFPHATIYSPEFPDKNLITAMETVGDIIETQKSMTVNAPRIGHSERMGFLYIDLELTEKLVQLHNSIVDRTNELREGHTRDKDKSLNPKKPEDIEKIRNVKQYGYPRLKNLYHPHVTLSRLANSELAKQAPDDLHWKPKKFTFDTVGIFKTGEHGTCVELLKEFKLI